MPRRLPKLEISEVSAMRKASEKNCNEKSDFYGCTGYPECSFTSFDPVADEKCPVCGAYTVEKHLKSGDFIKCSNKECSFKRSVEKDGAAQ